MKPIAIALVALLLPLTGCKKDSTTGPSNAGVLGGGVTWAISSQEGDGGIEFLARPSVAATITDVTVSCAAQQVQETLTGDSVTVYQPGADVLIGAYAEAASGQAWTFTFKGRAGSAQGAQYSTTANHTIP